MKNRTALITGASSGIGKELSLLLAAKGYDLVLVARRSDLLEELKNKILSQHRISVYTISKDLSKPEVPNEIYSELKEKNIDPEILVNNAGFGLYGEFSETEWAREKMMIDLNISALVYLTKLFLQPMLKNKNGKILNIASTAAFQPGPLMSVYFASKAFVLSFSEAIAEELKGSGVTVTALCPGPTESEFSISASMEDSKLFHGKKIPSAKNVAEYGLKALFKGQRVAIHGTQNYILANSVRFTPRDVVTRIVKFMQGRKKE